MQRSMVNGGATTALTGARRRSWVFGAFIFRSSSGLK
jgi:hypothetical protein